jgi:RNA polymerase sigma-70 factor (ECF subfamily)
MGERQAPPAGPGSAMPSKGNQTFEALALPHLEAVYRFARRLSRHDHEAEDLVQETYLKAYKAFDRFEMREFGIRPWLLKILHNTFLNRQSRENKAPRAAENETLEYRQSRGAGDSQVDPPALDYESLDEEVARAIDGLSAEFRSVLIMWSTMELTYQEVAEVMDVPIGTVMSRLHRARQQLASALHVYARQNRIAVSES